MESIAVLITALQEALDLAADAGEISEEEYEIAFHAACAIDAIVRPEEWEDADPLSDLANILARI